MEQGGFRQQVVDGNLGIGCGVEAGHQFALQRQLHAAGVGVGQQLDVGGGGGKGRFDDVHRHALDLAVTQGGVREPVIFGADAQRFGLCRQGAAEQNEQWPGVPDKASQGHP